MTKATTDVPPGPVATTLASLTAAEDAIGDARLAFEQAVADAPYDLLDEIAAWIDELAAESQATEYTDTDVVWVGLERIRAKIAALNGPAE